MSRPPRRFRQRDRQPPDPRPPLFPEDIPLPESDAEPEDIQPAAPTPPEERFPPLAPPAEKPTPPPRPPRSGCLYNLLSVFFILAALVLLAYFALLWVNPYHPLNPLPPFTPLPIIVSATPLPPTTTPIPTQTAAPTAAPTASPTAQSAAAPAVTFTPAVFPFTLSVLDVEYSASAAGCTESRIAGRVIDLQGAGVEDYGVRIVAQEGTLTTTVTTGSAPDVGPGGFSARLADAPLLAPYTLQLLGPDGAPLSEEYLIVTSDQCDQNVTLVQFVQNREF